MPTKFEIQRACRWFVLALAVVGVILKVIGPARADALPGGLVLVMVEEPSCGYCRKWLAEVGPFYASSRQGQRAPLVRLRVGDDSLRRFGRLVYTPTFLLVRDGREIDRIVGYAGAAEFWRQLEEMLEKSDDEQPAPSPAETPRPADREARFLPGPSLSWAILPARG